MCENKIRHLEMIQNVISRMAANSFALKGWAVTLIVGIFVLANEKTGKLYYLAAFIPVIVFWFLDSYYLQLERKYKVLYENVRAKTEPEIDFDMKTSAINIDINESRRLYFEKCLFSSTEIGFYLPCIILVTVFIMLVR